jgi:hypothetical protein|tara:strand:- start:1734 stop:2069 length:336 start_codon:yes stop_codon:yes gene_type:complete
MNELRGQLSLELGKDTHEVLLNLNAFRLLCKDKKIELTGLDEFVNSDPLDFIPTVIYWGVINACDFKGKPRPEVSFDHMSAIICSDLDKFKELSEAVAQALGTSLGGKEGN